MTFRCEDLREHGLILVPNTSLEYDPLLEDIQRRIENPPPGMPANVHRMFVGAIDPEDRSTSAILLNQSGKPIVSMEVVWRHEQTDGRAPTHTRSWNDVIGQRPSSLMDYWRHVLPGSKRYISKSGPVGDNSDVRPPAPEEIPTGGGGGSGRGLGHPRAGIVKVTLALAGVFFLGGEFAGSEESGIWERAVAAIAVWQEIGKLLREGNGFDRVEALTGPRGLPPPPPLDSRGHVLRRCAQTIAHYRKLYGDEAARERLISYIADDLPELRRL